MATKLSVLSVTYNNGPKIHKFLISLEKNLPEESEVVIVDSGSTDQTAQIVEKYSSASDLKIALIKGENKGFAVGNNKAAKKAEGEVLLILNPDTELSSMNLNTATEYLLSDEKKGLLGFKLITPDNSVQKSVRNFPTIKNAIEEFFFNRKNSFNEFIPDSDMPTIVDCVYGASMLIRKSDFEKIGGFDERYFLYFEDLDLCRKVKDKLEKQVIYYPDIKINHEVGKSGDSEATAGNLFSYIFPDKKTGRIYHQVKSSIIYHGFLTHFVITLIMFLGQKLNGKFKK